MSAPPSTGKLKDFPAPMLDAAVSWMVRRDRGFTASEAAEFAAWLRADAGRAAAVAELERTWDKFAALRELAPAAAEGVTEGDADAFAPPVVMRERPGKIRRLTVAGAMVAAAAVVVVGLGVMRSRLGDEPPVHRYATGVGELKRVMLPDGSMADLNAETALDVAFTPTERRVRFVRGAAHFSVAKNAARPFVVAADDVAVRAVGTAFSVRMASAAIEVLVTEGKVRVDDAARGESLVARRGIALASAVEAASAPLLLAGERIVIATTPGRVAAAPTTVTPDEIQRARAGRHRVIELQGTSLAAIVREFNRHGMRPLVIDDPELGELRIGGKFRVDEADAFVRLLETTFGVTAERTAERIVLRRK